MYLMHANNKDIFMTDLKERGCFGKTPAEVKIILKGLCRCELSSLVSE
jgi:hypothetical protein